MSNSLKNKRHNIAVQLLECRQEIKDLKELIQIRKNRKIEDANHQKWLYQRLCDTDHVFNNNLKFRRSKMNNKKLTKKDLFEWLSTARKGASAYDMLCSYQAWWGMMEDCVALYNKIYITHYNLYQSVAEWIEFCEDIKEKGEQK